MTSKHLLRTMAVILSGLLVHACGNSGVVSTPPTPAPTPASTATPFPAAAPPPNTDALVRIDEAHALATVPTALFGVNVVWEDGGHGIVVAGEMVADRSFRNLGTDADPWHIDAAGAAVGYAADTGDPTPGGHAGYPGALRVARGGGGTTRLSQSIKLPIVAGTTYELHVSTFGEGPTPVSLAAFLAAAGTNTPISSAGTASVGVGGWTRSTFPLTATTSTTAGLLLLEISGAGSVLIDEVRLLPAGLRSGLIDGQAVAALRSMGARGIRYPGGFVVERFVWPESVGPLPSRGELQNTAGQWQTPSLGLDEILALGEQASLDPELQVNVLLSADLARDLVEYVNGASTSPMGAIRTRNGHALPYHVRRFELGNEPSFSYVSGDPAGAGARYAALANEALSAMLAVDPSIEASATTEANFTSSDFLPAVPILASWNQAVLSDPSLLRRSGVVHGSFYSYHASHDSAVERWTYVMSAATVLARNHSAIVGGHAYAFRLGEYNVLLESGGAVETPRLIDAQAGLGVADILLAATQESFSAAHLFDFSSPVGLGAVRHDGSGWRLRPTGLAFSLFSPIGGEARIPCQVDGAPLITLGAGVGSVPTGLAYPLVAATATRQSNGAPRLFLINRSFDRSLAVAIQPAGAFAQATLRQLAPAQLDFDNEGGDAVAVQTFTRSGSGLATLVLPPHSVTRVDY